MVLFRTFAFAATLVLAGCAHRGARPTAAVAVQPVAATPAEIVMPTVHALPVVPIQQPAHIVPVAPTMNVQKQVGSMTLMSAIELALRNSEIVRVSKGGSVAADTVTGYDVAVAESRITAALAAFDSSWAADFYTSSISQPPNAFFGPGFQQPTLRDESSFNLSLNKQWLTGAKSSVTFNPDPAYLYLPLGNGSGFNPTYTGELEISARQPLLRGAGLAVNRVPIQIRQMETEQSAWEFKKAVMASARSVADAYWDLYAARIALRAVDDVIPLLEEIVRLQEESYRTEWVIEADVAKAYAQLHDFRQRQLAARSAVVEAELRLRNLMSLPPEDGWTIVPVTDPGKLPVAIDSDYAVYAAVENHPDLVRQRIETKIRELELVVARNGLLPNFDIRALYRMNGVGENVSGTIRQMFTAEYSDWLVGFTFSVPLGNRQASANQRAAELQLARANGLLHQQVLGVVHEVRDDIREADFAYQEFTEADRRKAAAADWLSGSRLRYENPRPGSEANWLLQSLNEYLFALRFHTEATADAAQVLARYNTALIELEETKGTLLESLNIDLAADPCRQSEWLPFPSGLPVIDTPTPTQTTSPLDLQRTRTPTPRTQLPAPSPPAEQIPDPPSASDHHQRSFDGTPSVINNRRLPAVRSPSTLVPKRETPELPALNGPSLLN